MGHEESAVFVPDEFQGKRADSMSAHGTSKAQVLEQHEQGLLGLLKKSMLIPSFDTVQDLVCMMTDPDNDALVVTLKPK